MVGLDHFLVSRLSDLCFGFLPARGKFASSWPECIPNKRQQTVANGDLKFLNFRKLSLKPNELKVQTPPYTNITRARAIAINPCKMKHKHRQLVSLVDTEVFANSQSRCNVPYKIFAVVSSLLLLVWKARTPIRDGPKDPYGQRRITRSCLTGQDHRTTISRARHLIIRRHMTLTDRKETYHTSIRKEHAVKFLFYYLVTN